MAGVDVGGVGGGARRSLNMEINMIPMIDLLMVTISFLLITAVWTHMARLNADAQVPGPVDSALTQVEPEARLHVDMRPDDRFVLAWKHVPRHELVTGQGPGEVVRFPELAAAIESQWRTHGKHANPTDGKLDEAVLHTGDKTEFKYVVGAIDAIYQTHRDMRRGATLERVPAFNMVFALK
jgi:hypothetical protein